MIDAEKLRPFIEEVARTVSSRFPSYVSAEDTAQDLWVWAYENENTVLKVMEDGEAWERRLRPLMTKAAGSSVSKEEAKTNGYSLDDVFEYSTTAVRALLENAFNYEDWQSFGQIGDGQPGAKRQVNESGDGIAMLVDVKSAAEKLNEDQYNTLIKVYRDHYTSAMLAFELDITEEAAKKRVSRAVQALRKRLGKKSLADLRGGWDDRRHSIGNAEAAYITDKGYEG